MLSYPPHRPFKPLSSEAPSVSQIKSQTKLHRKSQGFSNICGFSDGGASGSSCGWWADGGVGVCGSIGVGFGSVGGSVGFFFLVLTVDYGFLVVVVLGVYSAAVVVIVVVEQK